MTTLEIIGLVGLIVFGIAIGYRYLYRQEKKARRHESNMYASLWIQYSKAMHILSETKQELEATKAELELYKNHESET